MIAARILTAYYFIHFLIVFPLLGLIETPKPLPNSISEAVLKKGKAAAAVLLALGLGATDAARVWLAGLRRGRRTASAAQQVVVRRRLRQVRPGRSCSAASRSTRKSARPATA